MTRRKNTEKNKKNKPSGLKKSIFIVAGYLLMVIGVFGALVGLIPVVLGCQISSLYDTVFLDQLIFAVLYLFVVSVGLYLVGINVKKPALIIIIVSVVISAIFILWFSIGMPTFIF